MTFALAGRCERTGAFGAVAATCDIAVGARVAFAEAAVGAVLTQHRTDPRLGPAGLSLLREGLGADAAVAALADSTPHAAWRQLAAIDRTGATAAFSGAEVVTTACEEHGPDCVAIGNCLADAAVGRAMTAAFAAAPGEPLAERLVRALEAGADAGGETSPTRSAVVLVARDPGFSLVDLRVDDSGDPIGDLRGLWTTYRGWTADFRQRALDPDAASGAAGAGSGDGDLP